MPFTRPSLPSAPRLRGLLASLVCLGCVATTRAQVSFTVHTTADSTGFGYTAGQSVDFVFQTSGADLSANTNNTFSPYDNLWLEDFVTDTRVFTSVSGTGLGGAFTQPTVSNGAPLSSVGAIPPGYGQLSLQAKSEAFSSPSIGLTAGGYALEYLIANQLDWGQAFSAPGSYTPLSVFFAPYVGTHALNPGGYVEFYAGGTPVDFTPTSITISVVPEPATSAALLGGLALALGAVAAWKRRGAGSP